MSDKQDDAAKKAVDSAGKEADSSSLASATETQGAEDSRSPIERMQQSTAGINSPDSNSIPATLERQLKQATDSLPKDSPAYLYLHSSNPAERAKIREALRNAAQSEDPFKSSESIGALKTINFVEAATRLAETLKAPDPLTKADRYDAVRQLYGLRRVEVGNNGPAARVLEAAAEKEPIASDFAAAVMDKEWEQFVVDEQAGNLAGKIFACCKDALEAVRDICLSNKMQLDQGNDSLALLALYCRSLGPLLSDGSGEGRGTQGMIDSINDWMERPEMQTRALRMGKVMEAAGYAKWDEETSSFKAVPGATVDLGQMKKALARLRISELAAEGRSPAEKQEKSEASSSAESSAELRKLFIRAESTDTSQEQSRTRSAAKNETQEVDSEKLGMEIEELNKRADARKADSSKIELPSGQWRKFDRDESGKILRIIESNGNTWLASKTNSFINAASGERIEGDLKVEKDGSYKFVLEDGREISHNTDQSVVFSDKNGSVTINSDNSKLIRNAQGALVLIADANGRLTKLEPMDRRADQPASRIILASGKVWEKLADRLWKQPDAIDPVSGNRIAGDTMNGSFKVGENGDITLESAQSKESISFKADGSIVTRNEAGQVLSVKDNLGRSQIFTYKNNELIANKDYDGSQWTKVSEGVWAKEGTNIIWKGNRSIDGDGNLRLSTKGKEITRRTNGWEEHRDTNTGRSSFQHKTADNAIVVKDQEGKIRELRFANGDFRKFEYGENGAINKISTASGEVLSSTDGFNWKNESKPPEAALQMLIQISANGTIRQLSINGRSETVLKGDGSKLQAEDGRIVQITNPFGETRKFGWSADGNLTSIEESSKGNVTSVWTKSGDQRWQKQTSSGTPAGESFKGGFYLDGAGNLLQKIQTDKELSSKLFKSNGEILQIESGVTETPQKNGSRIFSNEKGQVLKLIDAAGKTTEFAYDENNRLNLIKNEAGNFTTQDGLHWQAKDAVNKVKNVLIPVTGNYEVLKDGTIKESLSGDNLERFHRTDGSTVIKDGESLKTLDKQGRIIETVNSAGEKSSFDYGPLKRSIGGKEISIQNQLRSITFSNGVRFTTDNGLDWKGSNGVSWVGVMQLKKDGTLQSIDTAGNESRSSLDGKTVKERRLDLLAKIEDSFNMLTHTWSNQAKWSGASRAAELDQKFTGMTAAEVQLISRLLSEKLGNKHSPDQVLKPLIGEGHNWEKILGHLTRADEANIDKVPGDDAAAIRTALAERSQFFGDRSSEGCEKSIRMTLQKLSHEQIEKLSDEYKNRYGEDLKSVLKNYAYFSEFSRKSIELYLKGNDKISTAERIAHMNETFKSRIIDHFEEACSGTSDAERQELIMQNGGYGQMMSLVWSNYGGYISARDALHAREALLYGGQTEAQKIRDSIGIFSNDQATIEKVLREMSAERREQFFNGEYLDAHPAEIKSDADIRAHEFYRNISVAFQMTSSDLNWNKGLRLAQLKDQVRVQGGGLIERLGDHKGYWTDSRKDLIKTVHDMTKSEWDALAADPHYLARLDLELSAAMGAENFAPLKTLLQQKLNFKAELDLCSSSELKEKYTHFKKLSESDIEKYLVGRSLSQEIQKQALDANGNFDPGKSARLEKKLKDDAASGNAKAAEDLQALEYYKSETFKAVKEGARRFVVDALEDTKGDVKAGIDIILQMTPEERKLYKDFNGPFHTEGEFQTQLHTKIETVFGKGTAAYETAMGLLKQIRDNKLSEAPKLSVIDKINLMSYDSSKKVADLLLSIHDSVKQDPALAEELRTNPKLQEDLKSAAIRTLSNLQATRNPAESYEHFIKPLIEAGHLSAEKLLRANSIDPDLPLPDRESLNKHILFLPPETLNLLNSNKAEREKLLAAFNIEDRKVIENVLAQGSKLIEARNSFLNSINADSNERKSFAKIIQQGAPKTAEENALVEKLSQSKSKELEALIKDWKEGAASPSEEIRIFVLAGGVEVQRIKSILQDMDSSQKRQLMQDYAAKYAMRDLRRDILDHASSAERPELDFLLRTSEYSAALKLNLAINQASSSDGISSSLLRYTGYGGTLTELRQDSFDMQNEVASATREGRAVNEKLIDELDLSFRESLVNFREAKEQFADSIVNTALTAAALGAAPFTGGASLAPIIYGMAAGAALKVGTHYMVSGADFEMSVKNISRKLASGMVEGGFSMVNPAHLGAMLGLGKAAAGQAAIMTARELNALTASLGSKALSKAGEEMLETEMKTLVAAALANRVAGVSEKELAALAQKIVAKEFTTLAEAQAKQLAAKLTESLSKNLQQAIANETKSFLLQAQKEAIHLAANASIGAGAATSGTLVEQAFTGKLDAAALMQAAQEGSVGALFGSAIGRGFHGAGHWRKIDEAGRLSRMSFAALQALGSGLGGDALAQGSLHGSMDISWDSVFNTLLDAGSGVKDAGKHGGRHSKNESADRHQHEGSEKREAQAEKHRHKAESDSSDSRKNQELENADSRKRKGKEVDRDRNESESDETPNYKNKSDRELGDLMYERSESSEDNERRQIETQIIEKVREEVSRTLKELGLPEDLIKVSFDLDKSDLKLDYTDPLEMMGVIAARGGFTAGSYYPGIHKIRVDFGADSPTTTLRHEIQHWYNAVQRTILAKADPQGFEAGLRESVKRQMGDGGSRLQDNSASGKAELVERLSFSARGREDLRELFETILPIAKAGEKALSKFTVSAVLKDPDLKDKVQLLLKEMGGDTKENRERLIQELIGEVSHYRKVLDASKISESTLNENPDLQRYIEERLAKLKEIAARPLALSDDRLARRELLDRFLKERGNNTEPVSEQEMHEWLKNLPVYDAAADAAGDFEASARAMHSELAHWTSLMRAEQAAAGKELSFSGAQLAEFILANRNTDQSGEDYVRALTRKYTSGASDSYTGRADKEEYRVGKEERSAKVAEHVFELRKQIAEGTFDPSSEDSSISLLENLRLESRLALIQVSLERGDLSSAQVKKAADNLLKFLQEKDGNYFKSKEIARLLINTGLLEKADFEKAGLGKLLAAEPGHLSGESAEAMNSEKTQKLFRSPRAKNALPEDLKRALSYESPSKVDLDREIAKLKIHFAKPSNSFQDTPQVLRPEFSGRLSPNQLIERLKNAGMQESEIFSLDPKSGKKTLNITYEQFAKKAIVDGAPVEMLSFKIGKQEVQMSAELAKTHDKIRELRRTVAEGQGKSYEQRLKFKEAEKELEAYKNVLLPEEIIARLQSTPDPGLCRILLIHDKSRTDDAWLTLKSKGENEGDWDKATNSRGAANIIQRIIEISPESTPETIERTINHEWSHLLEGYNKYFTEIFESAKRVEDALDKNKRYFHRDYSTLNNSEDWATSIGEVFLAANPAKFHEMIATAKDGSSKTKVLVELCAALRAAESARNERQVSGKAGENTARFQHFEALLARFQYAKKELLPEARKELLDEIEKKLEHPKEAIDAIRVLAFIGDPEAGDRMIALSADSKYEKLASELYFNGKLAAGGPPLDSKLLLRLAESPARNAVMPDLIRMAAKDESIKTYLHAQFENAEWSDSLKTLNGNDQELFAAFLLDRIENLENQPERALSIAKLLSTLRQPQLGDYIFDSASRIQNKELANSLYRYGKILSGSRPDTKTLIALTESGVRIEALRDLIREAGRDPEAKAFINECLKNGELTDPSKIQHNDALALMGELLRESKLEEQELLYTTLLKNLKDNPDLKADFLDTVILDEMIEDSLREKALYEMKNAYFSNLVDDSNGESGKKLSRNEVDTLVNRYSRGESGISRKEVLEALRNYGIAEMRRMGFGESSIELMAPRFFKIEDFNGKTLGGYTPSDGDITIALGRKLSERLNGNEIMATKTASHEIRHRINAIERSALQMAYPKEFRAALVEDVLQHTGRGGLRAQPQNDIMSYLVNRPEINETRIKASAEEINFMTAALRKYLNQPEDGSLAKSISPSRLETWLQANNLSFPQISPQRKAELLKDMAGEIEHANLIMKQSKLPIATINSSAVLKNCIVERSEVLLALSDSGKAYINKLLRGVSVDVTGMTKLNRSADKTAGEAYYLFSIEEVRANRIELAAEAREIMNELRTLIRNGPSFGQELRAEHKPESAQASEIWKLGNDKELKQYLDKLRLSDAKRAESIEKLLTEKDKLVKAIQFQNALEQFQKSLQELRTFSDPYLATEAAKRNVLQSVDGNNTRVADSPELAEDRVREAIRKIMQTVEPFQVKYVVSQMLEKNIPAEQMLISAPPSVAGSVAANLFQRDPLNFNPKKLLDSATKEQFESIVFGLLDGKKVLPGELLRDVARDRFAQLSSALLKRQDLNLAQITQMAINNDRLTDFIQSGLQAETFSLAQLRGLIAERLKAGHALLETKMISDQIDAFNNSKQEP
ncbi:MAG: hypothetical protein K2X27_15565 [Candidatus Obscuribacterales bacterium]|nr:hypothetical protein [Candidatus Obscuribacterales bacterium]